MPKSVFLLRIREVDVSVEACLRIWDASVGEATWRFRTTFAILNGCKVFIAYSIVYVSPSSLSEININIAGLSCG